jgi:DNA-binding MarR family transcriptional regulator
MTRKRDLIHRLHNLLDAIEARTGFDELDPTSKELLKHIGRSHSNGQRPSITEIALNRRFGSAATVFSRLSKLEKSGWLRMLENPDDGRSRLVFLSSKSQNAFDRMSAEVKSFLVKEQ